MRVLFCRIFGHKFYYTSFRKTGAKYLPYAAMWVDDGVTFRHETTYCTRCGMERSKINEKDSPKLVYDNDGHPTIIGKVGDSNP